MNISSLLRFGGVALLGATAGGAGMLWWQMRSLEGDLNRSQSLHWYDGGDAYVVENGASEEGSEFLENDLHLHDTYYVIADVKMTVGLAGMALGSILLIAMAGPIGRRMQRQETVSG